MSSDLSVELPYYVEEEYGTEELESRYLHEPYDSERKYDTEDRRTSNSPEYRLFAIGSSEPLGCHTDEDRIVTTHHEIYHDDVEEGE